MASTAGVPPARVCDRARGALLGLAVGDALGAPAENLRPSEIRARWGRITGYVAARPAGTDDTEYALFSGLLLARHGSALTPAHVEAAWHEHITVRAEGPFRGAGFSERGTLENLRRGLAAPVSAQHRHAWSDGLAMRAAPFGVFAAGRPAEAARLVAVDGSVSHEGEGIHGGRAVAAGVAAAMAGAHPVAVVAAALAVVPDDSWTARSLRRAAAAAHRGERAIRSAVVIAGYPWSDLAPEAVALAFGAYAAADGDFRDAVLTAVNMGRDADTTAAVAGALAGATQGVAAVPEDWAAAIGPARGTCLPSVAGRHVLEVADLLVARAVLDPGDGGGAGLDGGAELPGGAGLAAGARLEGGAGRSVGTGQRAGAGPGAGAGTGLGVGAGQRARTGLGAGAGTGLSVGAGQRAGMSSDTGAGQGAAAGPGAQNGPGPGSGASAGNGPGSGNGPEAGSGPGRGAGPVPVHPARTAPAPSASAAPSTPPAPSAPPAPVGRLVTGAVPPGAAAGLPGHGPALPEHDTRSPDAAPAREDRSAPAAPRCPAGPDPDTGEPARAPEAVPVPGPLAGDGAYALTADEGEAGQ